MTLLSNVLGFAAFGVGARMWQLGIQKRPIASGPAVYAILATAFGTVGYWAEDIEKRQIQLIHKKEAEIRERREALGQRQQVATTPSDAP